MLTFDSERVTEARIALGSLAPTIVRAATAEEFLVGKRLTPEAAPRRRPGLRGGLPDRRCARHRRLPPGKRLPTPREPRWRSSAGARGRPVSPTIPILLDRIPSRPALARWRAVCRARSPPRINGRANALRARRLHASSMPSRGCRADRHQGGLRRRRVRRLHRPARRPGRHGLPGPAPQAHGPRSRRSRGWRAERHQRSRVSTRCSRRSSTTARCSAATASPGC